MCSSDLERSKPHRLTLTLPHHPMERRDILPLLLLTAIYALTAFFRLGDFNAPQSVVKFQQGDSYIFVYNEPVTVDQVSFYPSLGTGYYRLEWLDDEGETHSVKLDQPYNSLFKWRLLELDQVDQDGEAAAGEGAEAVGAATAARSEERRVGKECGS